MREILGKMTAKDRKFVIVASRWNEFVVKPLIEGAVQEILRHEGCYPELIHVPGTWEIPPVAKNLCDLPEASRPHGIICLGCILQGATTHAQLLASDVSQSLMRLQEEYGIPVCWGILTPETVEQAVDRAGMKVGNKGREAALAAIELADVIHQVKQ